MELKKKITIAIDGFSSCGKSSFAKLIAKKLDYIYIDSGAMYRAIALFALRNKLVHEKIIDSETLVSQLKEIDVSFSRNSQGISTLLNGETVEDEIRGVAVASVVSEVSKIKAVREHLVGLQQEMGRKKGLVMDGRDIGTVVFPDAEIKIFMKADVGVRAKRRYNELLAKGINASLEEIMANIEERDSLDINRTVSPLRVADDALILNNSYMTFEEQMHWFLEQLKEKDLLD